MRVLRLTSLLALASLLVVSLLFMAPVQAGERLLSVNSGTESHVWTIKDEPSLVMNGFDLTPLNILRPATIDRVTIIANSAVVGATSEIVIYQDVNGGSPADATLAGRQTVSIGSGGSNTFTLAQPVTITAPVVWVGFYLPVNFEFLGDVSGTSVLTYWAWTPGGNVDLTNLASAGVLGPGDGSSPVGINMRGTARITAEITGADAEAGTPVILQSFQTAGDPNVNLGVMAQYPDCEKVKWDTDDEYVSYQNAIDLFCRVVPEWMSPQFPPGFTRKGALYDIVIFAENGNQADATNILTHFVTHCIQPEEGDLERAVVGVAYGAPRVWRILPTQRFDGLVCAEVPHGGNLTYFVPNS
jgi:hypothetical protein